MKTHRELSEEHQRKQANNCFFPLKRIFELEKLETESRLKAEYAAIFRPENEKHHRDMAAFARAQQILLIEIALKEQKKIQNLPKPGNR